MNSSMLVFGREQIMTRKWVRIFDVKVLAGMNTKPGYKTFDMSDIWIMH